MTIATARPRKRSLLAVRLVLLCVPLLVTGVTSVWAGTFTATVTGGTIEIKYTPSANCDKVLLIQTVRVVASNEDGTMPMNVPFDKIDKLGHMNDDAIADGTAVDHSFCEKDPYYNGDDPQDGGTDGKKTALVTIDSTFTDTPGISVPKLGKPKVTAMYEVCAYCADTVPGTSLNECMTWTYMNSQANGETVMVTGGTGAGNAQMPSQSHTDAVNKFNMNHMNNTKCPEKDAADAVPGPGGTQPRDVDPSTVPPAGCSEGCIMPALSNRSILVLVMLLLASSLLLLRRGHRPPPMEVTHG